MKTEIEKIIQKKQKLKHKNEINEIKADQKINKYIKNYNKIDENSLKELKQDAADMLYYLNSEYRVVNNKWEFNFNNKVRYKKNEDFRKKRADEVTNKSDFAIIWCGVGCSVMAGLAAYSFTKDRLMAEIIAGSGMAASVGGGLLVGHEINNFNIPVKNEELKQYFLSKKICKLHAKMKAMNHVLNDKRDLIKVEKDEDQFSILRDSILNKSKQQNEFNNNGDVADESQNYSNEYSSYVENNNDNGDFLNNDNVTMDNDKQL